MSFGDVNAAGSLETTHKAARGCGIRISTQVKKGHRILKRGKLRAQRAKGEHLLDHTDNFKVVGLKNLAKTDKLSYLF